jgi:hypothetical protein
MNNQYSNDKEFEEFNDLNKSNDNVEFINKAIVRRGYAYYIHEVAHEVKSKLFNDSHLI